MKIKKNFTRPFCVSLNRPLQLKRNFIESRSGFIVALQIDDVWGYGEVAPLPYFHSEMQVEKEIDLALKVISNWQWSIEDIKNNPCFFGRKLQEYPFSASVMWGIETALWNVSSLFCNTTPRKLWKSTAGDIVEINGLLSGKYNDIKAQADILQKQQVQTVKLKVGRNSLEEDLCNIKYILDLNNKWKMRLDANRSWSLEEASVFIDSIANYNIEYIEEPVSKELFSQLPQNVNIAWDESVYEQKIPPQHPPFPKVVVLKPALIGGIGFTFEWISWANNNDILCVISSCFDTSIGLVMLANIAATTSMASGLDTYKWLEEDTLYHRFSTDSASIDLSQYLQQEICV
ncbi:o-succinylbenzoate synthase [Candidatus Uabimicrobium sp. HlEnr_7]|uniref:o-succinylbenzoate synthase n=1 Tax=Candidatus Uabimicrobium helgolandensis TaxID=3095367 RepID=UPI00355819FC